MKKDEPAKKKATRPKRNPAKGDADRNKKAGIEAGDFSNKTSGAKRAPRRDERTVEEKRTASRKDGDFSTKTSGAKRAPRRDERTVEEKRTASRKDGDFSKKTSGAKRAPRRDERPVEEKRTASRKDGDFSNKTSGAKRAPRQDERTVEEKRVASRKDGDFSNKTSGAKRAPRRDERTVEEKRTASRKDGDFSTKTSGAKRAPRRDEHRDAEKRVASRKDGDFSKKTTGAKRAPSREDKPSGGKNPFWEPFAKKQPERREEPEERFVKETRPRSRPVPEPLPPPPPPPVVLEEPMRLNKFIAHCGISARRQAAEYVKQGLIAVNGQVELNPGYLVQPEDEVTFKGEPVRIEEQKVYILMNKPKNVITTASDEKGRKTVLEIVGKKVKERIFPVGRLDRMTTGLLLLTNDGDLAKKLSHPKHKVEKFYIATLDKPLNKVDLERIQKGLMLEDGTAEVDSIDYVNGRKDELGIELHTGKNRIVRRIFEHLGYEVVKLDRTYYAGLTKKDVGRGHFRHLTEKEVIMLKHFK